MLAAVHNLAVIWRVVRMPDKEEIMFDAKTLVTVTSVRVANGKMMTAGKGSAPPPTPPTPRVASTMRDVATGGQRAMQSLKKA